MCAELGIPKRSHKSLCLPSIGRRGPHPDTKNRNFPKIILFWWGGVERRGVLAVFCKPHQPQCLHYAIGRRGPDFHPKNQNFPKIILWWWWRGRGGVLSVFCKSLIGRMLRHATRKQDQPCENGLSHPPDAGRQTIHPLCVGMPPETACLQSTGRHGRLVLPCGWGWHHGMNATPIQRRSVRHYHDPGDLRELAFACLALKNQLLSDFTPACSPGRWISLTS